MIGDGWPDAVNVEVLSEVVASASVGKAWLGQRFGASVLAIAQCAPLASHRP